MAAECSGLKIGAISLGRLVGCVNGVEEAKMSNTDQHENKSRVRTEYLQTAFHFYITARFATINSLTPVAGYLAHHAIEMFVKAALVEATTEEERMLVSQDLPRIWQKYKQLTANPALDTFDRTINDLDRFENARNPDRLSRYGMILEVGFGRDTSPTQPTELRYQMALEELDELVKLIFETSGINAASFVNSTQPDALRYLNERNQAW
jgi:HEPN domain-containing protein